MVLIPGIAFPGRCWASLSATTGVKTLSTAQHGPPTPFTLAPSGFQPAVCHPSNFFTSPPQRVDACAAFAMLLTGSRLPFDSLPTLKLSAAALHCVLLGVQQCVCQPSKPQTPHSGPAHRLLEDLSVPFAAGFTLHSGATHCPVQTAQPSAEGRHTVLLGVQACHLPPFKPLNAPQRPYRLCCGGFQTAGCQPSNATALRSGPTHSVVGALRRLPPFKRVNLPQQHHTFSSSGFKRPLGQPQPPIVFSNRYTFAAALQTVLSRL